MEFIPGILGDKASRLLVDGSALIEFDKSQYSKLPIQWFGQPAKDATGRILDTALKRMYLSALENPWRFIISPMAN
jgi:hypothetical protein